MDNINMNQGQSQDQEPTTKTFTQEELDKAVKDSIASEREKFQKEHETAMAEMEKSIKARELKMDAMEQLHAKGFPTNLVDALNCSDEETMNNSIALLSKAFGEYSTQGKNKAAASGITPVEKSGPSKGDPIRSAMGL